MPRAGLEPARPKTGDFKSPASANSATRAIIKYRRTWILSAGRDGTQLLSAEVTASKNALR